MSIYGEERKRKRMGREIHETIQIVKDSERQYGNPDIMPEKTVIVNFQ